MPKHDNPIEETLLALQASLGVISLAHEAVEDPYAEQALSTVMATLATAHALVEKHLEDPHAISEPRAQAPAGMGQDADAECPHERAQQVRDFIVCLDCAEALAPAAEGEEQEPAEQVEHHGDWEYERDLAAAQEKRKSHEYQIARTEDGEIIRGVDENGIGFIQLECKPDCPCDHKGGCEGAGDTDPERQDGWDLVQAARIAACPNPEYHGNPFRYCPCGWIEPADAS